MKSNDPKLHAFEPEDAFLRHRRQFGGESKVPARTASPCRICERDRSEHANEVIVAPIQIETLAAA